MIRSNHPIGKLILRLIVFSRFIERLSIIYLLLAIYFCSKEGKKLELFIDAADLDDFLEFCHPCVGCDDKEIRIW
ncbi:MAG: hypothetical protein ACD_62C00003G0016 [uncultured bacterium]|nr:MAG: hypothetical protein ACD_62C00003G0016 [uncultured bacterium]